MVDRKEKVMLIALGRLNIKKNKQKIRLVTLTST